MTIQQQVATETRETVSRRPVPFAGTSITATSSGLAQIFATAEGQGAMEVKRLAVVNTTSSVANLTLHAVPDGSIIGADTAQIVGLPVLANTSVDLTEIIGGFYPNKTALMVWSDAAGALTLSGRWDDVF